MNCCLTRLSRDATNPAAWKNFDCWKMDVLNYINSPFVTFQVIFKHVVISRFLIIPLLHCVEEAMSELGSHIYILASCQTHLNFHWKEAVCFELTERQILCDKPHWQTYIQDWYHIHFWTEVSKWIRSLLVCNLPSKLPLILIAANGCWQLQCLVTTGIR